MYTGDEKWLRAPYAPGRQKGLDDNHDGGLPPEIQAEIRAAAARGDRARATVRMPRAHARAARADAQRRHGRGGAARVRADDRRRARARARRRRRPRRCRRGSARSSSARASPGWRRRSGWPRRGSRTSCSSATPTVGGTWLENHYPGRGRGHAERALLVLVRAAATGRCTSRCATSCTGTSSELADDFGVRERIRFDTEVPARGYDEDAQEWVVDARRDETLRANVLITAVGGFNKPKWPALAARTRSQGPVVHTARWPRRPVAGRQAGGRDRQRRVARCSSSRRSARRRRTSPSSSARRSGRRRSTSSTSRCPRARAG